MRSSLCWLAAALFLASFAASLGRGQARPTAGASAAAATRPGAVAGAAAVEATMRAVERDGVWYCEWTAVNGGKQDVDVPRGPSMVSWLNPKFGRTRELPDGWFQGTMTGGKSIRFRHVGRVTLSPGEGYTKRRALGKLEPGTYRLSVGMAEWHEHLVPAAITFQVIDSAHRS